MLYEDANGQPFGYDERVVPYPANLEIMIDAVAFRTVGRAVEERLPGSSRPRRWIAVSPVTSNGYKLRSRLIDERGVRGLRERAERARLAERS